MAGTRLTTRRRLKAAAAAAAAAASPATVSEQPATPQSETFVSGLARDEAAAGSIKKTQADATSAKRSLQRVFDRRIDRRVVKWETGQVLPKLLVFAIAIAGISSTMWNSRERPMKQLPTSGRLSQLEEVMKKTNKWMQLQLDLLDNKIGKEVEGVRADMEYLIDEKSVNLEAQVKKLKAQVQTVDDSLKVLYKEDLLTREETLELIKSAVEKRAEQGDGVLSLDDVRLAARQLVQNELEIHSADGIGRVDYALESGGGKVVFHSDGYFQGLHWSKMGLHIVPGLFRKHPMADRILKPSFGEPGQCLPLKGSSVFVDVRLRSHIYPQAVTLEHLSKKVAYDISSAPKEFRILGWKESSVPVVTQDRMRVLGEFVYDVDKGRIQTFSLLKNSEPLNMIRLQAVSNHGSPTHTCIYRLRVHGSPS